MGRREQKNNGFCRNAPGVTYFIKESLYLGENRNTKILMSFLKWLTTVAAVIFTLTACKGPKEDIQLKNIRDIVVDATSDPTLKANAIFFNPNNVRGKLRKVDVEIFVNGKKAANVKQDFNMLIPANGEFTVPLVVNLNMKELGFMDTLLGMVGGKKYEIRYEGSIKLNYRGIPVKVPVKYKDDVRLRF
jgi:LEA14-like dessication related protein